MRTYRKNMYIAIHNESEYDLTYKTESYHMGLMRGASTFINLSGCDKIVFYYEKGESFREYVRYFKEIFVDDINCSDLYISFKNDKIVIREDYS